MSRYRELYKDEIAPAMIAKFGYKNPMQVPRLEKIVVNVGAGEAKENVKIIRCGDVLEVGENKFDVVGKVPAHGVFVDGLGVGDVGNIVIRDRQHLSENGLMVVVITLDSGSNQVLSGPDIVSRGFVYVREAEMLIEQCKDVVSETLSYCLSDENADWNRIKNSIKEDLGEFLWQRTKRNPMILPIISEV